MRKIAEYLLLCIVILCLITVLLLTTLSITQVNDVEIQKMLYIVLIPILGAMLTGIGIELFKFILQRSFDEMNKKKETVALISKKAISICINIKDEEHGTFIQDTKAFYADLQEIAYLLSYTGSAECLTILKPLFEFKNLQNTKITRNDIKIALVNIIIHLRNTLGFKNTKESNLIINNMML